MPALEWRRAPCPVCGSRTARQAEDRCKTYSDETGEVYCKGACQEDAHGWLTQPTAESIARLDAWCVADMEPHP